MMLYRYVCAQTADTRFVATTMKKHLTKDEYSNLFMLFSLGNKENMVLLYEKEERIFLLDARPFDLHKFKLR